MELDRTRANNLAASLKAFVAGQHAQNGAASMAVPKASHASTALLVPPALVLGLDGAPGKVLRLLLLGAAGFALLNAVARTWVRLDVPQVEQFVRLFSVENELAIPTFYSAVVLLVAALLLAAVAVNALKEVRADRWHWTALVAVFVFLALDEATGIHESTIEIVRQYIEPRGVFYLTWVVPWIGFTAAFVIAFIPFILRLPPLYRNLFLLAGALFVGGAIGLEMLQGLVLDEWGRADWRSEFLPAIEEFMEMTGAALFVYAVVRYLVDHLGYRRIELR